MSESNSYSGGFGFLSQSWVEDITVLTEQRGILQIHTMSGTRIWKRFHHERTEGSPDHTLHNTKYFQTVVAPLCTNLAPVQLIERFQLLLLLVVAVPICIMQGDDRTANV